MKSFIHALFLLFTAMAIDMILNGAAAYIRK
jgi:hypothetical protein